MRFWAVLINQKPGRSLTISSERLQLWFFYFLSVMKILNPINWELLLFKIHSYIHSFMESRVFPTNLSASFCWIHNKDGTRRPKEFWKRFHLVLSESYWIPRKKKNFSIGSKDKGLSLRKFSWYLAIVKIIEIRQTKRHISQNDHDQKITFIQNQTHCFCACTKFFIFLLSPLHFILHLFFTFLQNISKKHPISSMRNEQTASIS